MLTKHLPFLAAKKIPHFRMICACLCICGGPALNQDFKKNSKNALSKNFNLFKSGILSLLLLGLIFTSCSSNDAATETELQLEDTLELKRSEINSIILEAKNFFECHHFHLPPFAFWTPQEWEKKASAGAEIIAGRLGWDITDFGKGDFQNCGLLLFTLRNGVPGSLAQGTGKLYAEKIMVVGPDQLTPLHFHWTKVEDIINRGGGDLVLRLFRATPEGDLTDSDLAVSVDGMNRQVRAGGTVVLKPGESITLEPYCYHEFWGQGDRVMVGEVSAANDDETDNRFFDPLGRFPEIEEDELPLHLLCTDYEEFLTHE